MHSHIQRILNRIISFYIGFHPASTVLSKRRAAQNWCSSLLYGTRLPPLPDFIIGWDCPWNREERNIVDKDPFVPGDLDKDKLNKGWNMAQYSINCSTCLYVGPLGQEKLDNQMVLLAVREAVSSHNEGRSRSAVKSFPLKKQGESFRKFKPESLIASYVCSQRSLARQIFCHYNF